MDDRIPGAGTSAGPGHIIAGQSLLRRQTARGAGFAEQASWRAQLQQEAAFFTSRAGLGIVAGGNAAQMATALQAMITKIVVQRHGKSE